MKPEKKTTRKKANPESDSPFRPKERPVSPVKGRKGEKERSSSEKERSEDVPVKRTRKRIEKEPGESSGPEKVFEMRRPLTPEERREKYRRKDRPFDKDNKERRKPRPESRDSESRGFSKGGFNRSKPSGDNRQKESGKRTYGEKRSSTYPEKRKYSTEEGGRTSSYTRRESGRDKPEGERNERKQRPFRERNERGGSSPFTSRSGEGRKEKVRPVKVKKNPMTRHEKPAPQNSPFTDKQPIRLNRYLSVAGICSRREADELIKSGKVTVNGEVVTEMGLKVTPGKDVVTYNKEEIQPKKLVYILLNKPKNTITTTEDPEGRMTVMDLIKDATRERVFPVGRLDRNTTGLLLLTNDGELSEKLTHPSHGIRKIYKVTTDRDVNEEDIRKLKDGFDLEDGFIKADKAGYLEEGLPNELGIEIHSGRNRIVRRMLSHLGYEVRGLDRVMFGPLTKKKLKRGWWRFLTEEEVGWLKML